MKRVFDIRNITIIILILLISIIIINYANKINGSTIFNATKTPFTISNINDESGAYRGWPGEIVGARISPARLCYNDSGSTNEMDIYIYGGEYPYDYNIRDYDHLENNNDIYFGGIRVTTLLFQNYFDYFGTFPYKTWPVWFILKCGGYHFDIKNGDALIIRYDNHTIKEFGNEDLYIKLPEINGTGDRTFFVSWTGEVYNNSELTGGTLAPKICSPLEFDYFVKANCTDDWGTKTDSCIDENTVQDWFCEFKTCRMTNRNCQQFYGTKCVNGTCVKPYICTPGEKKCDISPLPIKIKICASDGSYWSIERTCNYGCENGKCTETSSRGEESYETQQSTKITKSQERYIDIIKSIEESIETQSITIQKKVVSCEFVWPQKIIIDGQVQQCNFERPYCNNNMAQQGLAQCCKYNGNYYDCQTII